MADFDDTQQDDELLQDDAPEQDEADEQQDTDEQGDDAEDDDSEMLLEVEGAAVEPSGGRDSDLIKHLRNELKDAKRQLAEAKRQQPVAPVADPGPRPTLEACDYDEDAFAQRLDKWHEDKRAQADADRHREQVQEQDRQRAQQDRQRYDQARASLRFADVESAEEAFGGDMQPWQQAAILRYADDPAKAVYAIGKLASKRQELAAIDDPFAFIKAVAKMEGSIKMTKRAKPPAPERTVRGSASLATGVDKEEARLEKEAERTGDRTALINYRRNKR